MFVYALEEKMSDRFMVRESTLATKHRRKSGHEREFMK
jgi:hypothetical protein